jgi:hypothetical protein
VRSRLNSHLTESSPTLFHSGLGSVDPVAVRLEMTHWPGNGASYDEHIAAVSALLHERHHWLQHVGTSAGLFSSLLLELQASTIAGGVPLDALRASDLPLLRHEERFASPLLVWERLEATRRLYFGCRPADFEVLADEGRGPFWRDLAPLFDPAIEAVLADASDMAKFLAVRNAPDLHVEVGTTFVRDAGWSVGARHLMEGAARQSEVFRLLSGALDRYQGDEPFRFALNPHYTGIYGVARKMFFNAVRAPTAAAEIGFAFACDLALNCLSPPLYPFPPHNPGTYFGHVITKLASFRFDRVVDAFNPQQVRALLEELTEHAGDDLVVPTRFKRDMMNRFLGHLHPDEVAQQMFTVTGNDYMPVPTGSAVRLRYEFALSAQAEHLRAQAPEVFVFPVAPYTDDRAAFRALFEQIQPPLLSYGASGISPSRPMPGWLEFFLATAVQREVYRGMVMFDVAGIGARLAPYVRSALGREHGLAVVHRVLRGVFHNGPIAEDIWQHAVAAAKRKSGHDGF